MAVPVRMTFDAVSGYPRHSSGTFRCLRCYCPRSSFWGWFGGEFLQDYEALVASRRINRIFIQAEATQAQENFATWRKQLSGYYQLN